VRLGPDDRSVVFRPEGGRAPVHRETPARRTGVIDDVESRPTVQALVVPLVVVPGQSVEQSGSDPHLSLCGLFTLPVFMTVTRVSVRRDGGAVGRPAYSRWGLKAAGRDTASMDESASVVDPETVPTESFQTCETAVRKLTDRLGCTEMRANQVLVDPGEVTTPHTHDGQEEVFVAMTDGQIAIEGDVREVPAGGLVRVHPDTVRNLCNHTDERHVWLAFGAPPVGTVEDFGSYVVEE